MQLGERLVATHSSPDFFLPRFHQFPTSELDDDTYQEGSKVSGTYEDAGEMVHLFLTLIRLKIRQAQLLQ
jgi:hypothetical protein